MISSIDYVKRVAYPVRDQHGRLIGWRFPQGGATLLALWDRPPLGRPFAGRLSTAAGRGHRRCASEQARVARCALAYRAFRMRTEQGMTIRQIAAQVDRSPSLVGRWLRDIPACGPHVLDGLTNDLTVFLAQLARQDAVYERDQAGRSAA